MSIEGNFYEDAYLNVENLVSLQTLKVTVDTQKTLKNLISNLKLSQNGLQKLDIFLKNENLNISENVNDTIKLYPSNNQDKIKSMMVMGIKNLTFRIKQKIDDKIYSKIIS